MSGEKLHKRHERDIVELALRLDSIHQFYRDSSITCAEFVGNLEAMKLMALREQDEADDGLDEIELGAFRDMSELVDAFLGRRHAEGGDGVEA